MDDVRSFREADGLVLDLKFPLPHNCGVSPLRRFVGVMPVACYSSRRAAMSGKAVLPESRPRSAEWIGGPGSRPRIESGTDRSNATVSLLRLLVPASECGEGDSTLTSSRRFEWMVRRGELNGTGRFSAGATGR